MDKQLYLNLSAPIEGASPAGVDASDSDAFGIIDLELEKAQGLNIQSLDWSKIQSASVELLSTQTKDLRVAGFLVIALYELHGFAGLETGLTLFGDIVNADYWADLYPKRKKKQNKARATSFAWAVKRIERLLETVEVTPDSDFEQLLALAKAFNHADNALYNRLEDDAPQTMAAKNRFKRIVQEAQAGLELAKPAVVEPEPEPEPKPVVEPEPKLSVVQRAKDAMKSMIHPAEPAKAEPEPAPVEAAIEPPPPPPPPPPPQEQQQAPVAITATAPMSNVTRADVDKALDGSRKTIESVVGALRSTAEYDPWAFYLSRMAKWMTLDELPPDGVMPPNPSEAQMDALNAQAKSQQHKPLISEVEKLFEQGAIFNMALHRMVANALDALDETVASQMVKTSMAQLVIRLPELRKRKFSGQQPFMDGLTQNWLDSCAVMGAPASSDSANQAGDESGGTESAPWVSGFDKAMALAAKGDFEGGIAIITEGINTAAGFRAKTYWQLMQARLCDSDGHHELAVSQLQTLETRSSDPQLLTWEPSLRVDIITELLQCHMKNMTKNTYTAEQKQALKPLHDELSLAAPVVALSIKFNK